MRETFIKPLLCAIVMGVGCFGSYQLSMLLIKSNAISTIFAIVVAVVIYGLMLIFTKTITEEELTSIPKGGMIIKICKKIQIL